MMSHIHMNFTSSGKLPKCSVCSVCCDHYLSFKRNFFQLATRWSQKSANSSNDANQYKELRNSSMVSFQNCPNCSVLPGDDNRSGYHLDQQLEVHTAGKGEWKTPFHCDSSDIIWHLLCGRKAFVGIVDLDHQCLHEILLIHLQFELVEPGSDLSSLDGGRSALLQELLSLLWSTKITEWVIHRDRIRGLPHWQGWRSCSSVVRSSRRSREKEAGILCFQGLDAGHQLVVDMAGTFGLHVLNDVLCCCLCSRLLLVHGVVRHVLGACEAGNQELTILVLQCKGEGKQERALTVVAGQVQKSPLP